MVQHGHPHTAPAQPNPPTLCATASAAARLQVTKRKSSISLIMRDSLGRATSATGSGGPPGSGSWPGSGRPPPGTLPGPRPGRRHPGCNPCCSSRTHPCCSCPGGLRSSCTCPCCPCSRTGPPAAAAAGGAGGPMLDVAIAAAVAAGLCPCPCGLCPCPCGLCPCRGLCAPPSLASALPLACLDHLMACPSVEPSRGSLSRGPAKGGGERRGGLKPGPIPAPAAPAAPPAPASSMTAAPPAPAAPMTAAPLAPATPMTSATAVGPVPATAVGPVPTTAVGPVPKRREATSAAAATTPTRLNRSTMMSTGTDSPRGGGCMFRATAAGDATAATAATAASMSVGP